MKVPSSTMANPSAKSHHHTSLQFSRTPDLIFASDCLSYMVGMLDTLNSVAQQLVAMLSDLVDIAIAYSLPCW